MSGILLDTEDDIMRGKATKASRLEMESSHVRSRGLEQMSYVKGMRILEATQSDSVALENNALKQGLLAYALIRDGIEARQADRKPKDGVITMVEWLQYGVDRVPRLYEEVKNGGAQAVGATVEKVKVVSTNGIKDLDEVVGALTSDAKTQRPSLFDFARKRNGVVLTR